MKKTFVWLALILAFNMISATEIKFFAAAKSKKPLKTANDSRLKTTVGFNKKEKNDLRNKTISQPVLFEENRGQFAEDVKFASRAADYNCYLTRTGAVFSIPNLKQPAKSPFILSMRMVGASAKSDVQGVEKAVTKSGYFIGNDQSKWLTEIDNFQKVELRRIYEGIDLIFKGSEQKLEYDFKLAPQSDPDQIRIEFDGIKKIEISRAGDLIFKFKGNELRHQKPFAYQIIDGEKREINVGYVLSGKNRIGFKIGEYDNSKELVIDPTVYASYLGGSEGGGDVEDITVDRNGNIYTASDERIQKNPSDPYSTFSNIVVTKFNPAATVPIYRYSYGGSADDGAFGIDVDLDGKAYLTGITYSNDFPLHFAEQSSHSINRIQTDYMAFVMRLNENGTIHYSTYLGGGCAGTYTQNYGQSIVADSSGNAYVTGSTCSSEFPVKNAFQTSKQSSFNSFLTKYDSFGHIVYSTYFGGSGDSSAGDVVTDGQGNAYITGDSRTGLYTTTGAYKNSGLGFAAKFDTTKSGGQSLVYSTYIDTPGTSAAVDRSGNLWVGTRSGYCGLYCFVAPKLFKLNADGTGLMNSPLPISPEVWDIAIDANDNLFYVELEGVSFKVVGRRSDGTLIERNGFDTGTDITRIWGVATGPEPGIVYIAGITDSTNFPTTPDAYQPTHNSPNTQYFGQGFFTKFSLSVPLEEKTPLIFVPGVSGSWLDAIESDGSQTNLWLGLFQNHNRLTLDPNQTQANILATDAIRRVVVLIPIPGTNPQQYYPFTEEAYGPLLEKLINQEHYVEYQVNGQPSRRTSTGCDVSGQMANKPNLFVFAYDWRKSNIENAQALKDYVGCVKRFYPDSKVNILAHSMGGLLARRYIISNPNDHHIDKMVTIGSPWLGAPKAIEVLKNGNFLPQFIVWNSTIRRLGEFFKGMHELLPSRTYFDTATRSDFHLANYGTPFKEAGWDVNNNGNSVEIYNYDQTINLLNQQQPRSNPGSNNQSLHDITGQDNWLGDTSGVKYFHIYGQQSYLNTTIQVIAKYRIKCNRADCQRTNYYDAVRGRGDGTVPTISAERSFGPYYNLLPRNDKPFFSSNRSQDTTVEHTKLTQNPAVQQEVIKFLNSSTQPVSVTDNQFFKDNSTNPTESLTEPGAESVEPTLREGYYVNVSGVDYVEVRDDLGNVNNSLDGGYTLAVPSVNYDLTSEKSIAITTPTEGSYTLTFRSGNEPVFLEILKGIGNLNPTEAVRYLDLNLPENVKTQFRVSSTGVTDLHYDSDGDGTFETPLLPTSHTSGNAAKDLTPPTIQMNEIIQPSRQLNINSSDVASGVRKTYYSFDGTNFQEYIGSIPLARSQSGTIYAFADDNNANRALIATYTFVPIPDPIVTISSPLSGAVYPVGTTVNFVGNFSGDSCNSHSAIWTFDNLSQDGTINKANGAVTANYTFASAGVYLVSLTVNNSCGGTGSANTVDGLTALVVIYDPNGGFVTGGGWINSPLGAYTPNPNLTGRASFGFNSKYQRGANVPTGNTEFQFRTADFNFKSTSYDWLVVGGAKAQYKGSGTINGNSNYAFLLTAIDGQINGGGGQDKFRIKIWDKTTNVVIYDNQLGSGDNDNPTTTISGGSIIIHK